MKNIDWSKVQKERDAGERPNDLAKKYNVSSFTIYAHTTGSKPGRPKTTASTKNTHHETPVPHVTGGIAGVIASLEQERARLTAEIERINKAIEMLKGLK